MRTAFVAFEGMTTLDLVGVYEPIVRLSTMGFRPDLEWDLCARERSIADGAGLRLVADVVGGTLAAYDLVVAPGGPGAWTLRRDERFLDWLRTAASADCKASACTGALLLGAAGFLEGKAATTHPEAYEELAAYGARVVRDRVVDAGDVVTARGVTSSIDLGLHLVERLAGEEARTRIAARLDYVSPV